MPGCILDSKTIKIEKSPVPSLKELIPILRQMKGKYTIQYAKCPEKQV